MSRKLTVPLGLAIALVVMAAEPVATLAGGILPSRVEPVKPRDLLNIYADKTWQWENGAGRFELKGRRFIAWSADGGSESYAEGRWSVNNKGTLCFKAVWTAASGSGPARTCFEHVRDRGTIYQRRAPDGEWYIFKTYRPVASDEIRKLVSKDTVSEKVESLKERLNGT